MQSGNLDQRVTFTRKNVTGVDSMGAEILGTPTDLGTFWAHVGFVSGQEMQDARQRWAEARYKITIRRQPGVTLQRDDTATWNSQTLDVLDIRGPGTREPYWEIFAKDHVA